MATRGRGDHRGHGGDRRLLEAGYYSLEGLFEGLWLCNAQHVKNVPGRKTDLTDAEWLADVAAHGMVRPSFIPPAEIRAIREMTRSRKTQVDARTQEIQRLEKVLQNAGIKLSSVASGVWNKASKEIIEAMISGERDPKVLAQMAKSCTRAKIPQLEEALSGHFGPHHTVVCRQVIEHIEFLDESIATLTAEIANQLIPFRAAITIITSITGVSRISAEIMVAEMGVDMSRFPTAIQLCAWAGVAPASHESAEKRKPYGTRHGSTWLQRALIEAARAAARTKGTYFSAQYSRIARRRGPNRAAVAVAHSVLNVTWHLLTTGAIYDDPGADSSVAQRLRPSRQRVGSRSCGRDHRTPTCQDSVRRPTLPDATMLSGTVLEAGEDPRSDRVLEAVGPWRVLAWHGAYARDGAEVVDAMPGGRAWRTELEALAPEGEHHLLTFEGQATHLAPRDVPLLEHEDAGGMARGEIVGDPESVKGEIDRLSCAGFNEVVYTPERT